MENLTPLSTRVLGGKVFVGRQLRVVWHVVVWCRRCLCLPQEQQPREDSSTLLWWCSVLRT